MSHSHHAHVLVAAIEGEVRHRVLAHSTLPDLDVARAVDHLKVQGGWMVKDATYH